MPMATHRIRFSNILCSRAGNLHRKLLYNHIKFLKFVLEERSCNPCLQFWLICQKVSHHPPVSAFFVANRKDGFCLNASILTRSKFYGMLLISH